MPRPSKAKAHSRTARSRVSLLQALARSSSEMPSCSNCEALGFLSCAASASDSARCDRCIRGNRSSCDVLGPSDHQLRVVARSFHSTDQALELAEEEAERAQAKVRRLRRQRRVLADKVHRMVRRGLDSLEELDRVEAEERRLSELPSAEPFGSSEAAAPGPSAADPAASVELDLGFFDWPSPGFAIDPSLLSASLADPGVVGGTVEQVPERSPSAP